MEHHFGRLIDHVHLVGTTLEAEHHRPATRSAASVVLTPAGP